MSLGACLVIGDVLDGRSDTNKSKQIAKVAVAPAVTRLLDACGARGRAVAALRPVDRLLRPVPSRFFASALALT